jgi:hypothetical protein
MLYDAFFVPPMKPEIGDRVDQCLAVSPIRNPAGNVVRWHAKLTSEQWEHHRQNGGQGFNAARMFVGKTISIKDKDGNDVSKTAPIHTFFGMGVVDGDEKKIYTGDAGEDIDLEVELVTP